MKRSWTTQHFLILIWRGINAVKVSCGRQSSWIHIGWNVRWVIASTTINFGKSKMKPFRVEDQLRHQKISSMELTLNMSLFLGKICLESKTVTLFYQTGPGRDSKWSEAKTLFGANFF